jgi:hypothetical protein
MIEEEDGVDVGVAVDRGVVVVVLRVIHRAARMSGDSTARFET